MVSLCLLFLWYCVDWEQEQKVVADRVCTDEKVCVDADIQQAQQNRVNGVHHSVLGDDVDYMLL